MSLLARSLLALACAALLHAAFAQDPPPNKCSSAQLGNLRGHEIEFEIIIETSRGPVVAVEIPDNCKLRLRLQGEIVKACDYNEAPTMVFDAFRNVVVTRHQFTYSEPDTILYVTQYCVEHGH